MTPTVEQRQATKIRSLERRNRGQAAELRRLDSLLIERKAQLNLLGIAWSTRGAATREGELTLEEVKRLIAMVNRIQSRFFNTEYKIFYASLEERHRRGLDAKDRAITEYVGKWAAASTSARRWKALAKKLRGRK